MNKNFKLVFNKKNGTWSIASELSKSRGKNRGISRSSKITATLASLTFMILTNIAFADYCRGTELVNFESDRPAGTGITCNQADNVTFSLTGGKIGDVHHTAIDLTSTNGSVDATINNLSIGRFNNDNHMDKALEIKAHTNASLTLTGTNNLDVGLSGGGVGDRNAALVISETGNATINIQDSFTTSLHSRDGVVLHAISKGDGAAIVAITASGSITHEIGQGIVAQTKGGAIDISIKPTTNNSSFDITSAKTAILADNQNANGQGIINIDVGNLNSTTAINTTGAKAHGVHSIQNGSGDTVINIAETTTIKTSGTESAGIKADSSNNGSISITNASNITTTGDKSHGIDAKISGISKTESNLFVNNSGDIITNETGDGINASIAEANNSQLLQVVNTGNITTNTGSAIQATQNGNGNIEIQSGDVDAVNNPTLTVQGINKSGINTTLSGTGTTTIINASTINATGASSTGITAHARDENSGTISISNTANISTNGSTGYGIRAQQNGTGDIIIQSQGAIETIQQTSSAIIAISSNTGDINIANTASISTLGSSSSGINARSSDGAIIINNTGTINTTGRFAEGINASQDGTGNITIINNADITTNGSEAFGIYASTSFTSNGNIIIADKVSKDNEPSIINEIIINEEDTYGIYVEQQGSGDTLIQMSNTTITTSKEGAAGIFATQAGSGKTIINYSNDINTSGNFADTIAIKVTDGSSEITLHDSANLSTSGTEAHGVFLTASDSTNLIQSSTDSNINIAGISDGINATLLGNSETVINNHGTINHNIDTDTAGVRAIFSEDDNNITINQYGVINGSEIGIAVEDINTTAAVNSATVNLYSPSLTNKIGISMALLDESNINVYAGSEINAQDTAILLTKGNTALSNTTIQNAGILSSEQDKIIVNSATNPDVNITINNLATGEMTGYISMGDEGIITINNDGQWTVQDRANETAIIKLTNNAANVFNNNGVMSFANERTEILGATSTYLNKGGVFDLTSNDATTTELHIGKDNPDSVFYSNGGAIRVDITTDESEPSRGISDQIYLQNVEVSESSPAEIFLKYTAGSLTNTQNDTQIKIIDVAGESASNAFVLGHDAFMGLYEYNLQQIDNNWYLINNDNDYRADAGLELAMRRSVIDFMVPGLAGSGVAPNGITGSGAMRSQLRMNALDNQSATEKSSSVWALSSAHLSEGSAERRKLTYDAKMYTLQVGADTTINTSNGLWQVGGMAHMSTARAHSRSTTTGSIANGYSDGYGLGFYGTYFFNADDTLSPYVDLFAIYGRYKNTNKTRNNNDYDYKANAFSGTINAGYPIQITPSVIFEPQVQLSYVKYDNRSHVDFSGSMVDFKTKGNFIGRVGGYLILNTEKDFQPYVAMNLWYDDTQAGVGYDTGMALNGQKTTINADRRNTFYEAKTGFQFNTSKNLSVWGEVSGRVGRQKYKDYGVAIGIKYTW